MTSEEVIEVNNPKMNQDSFLFKASLSPQAVLVFATDKLSKESLTLLIKTLIDLKNTGEARLLHLATWIFDVETNPVL